MSSQSPINPKIRAGPSTDAANQNVLEVKFESSEVPNETVVTPTIIATPPKYGTDFLWDLCAAFG